MPAKVIVPSDEPDLSVIAGELTGADFQDCVNIVTAYERGVHYSATEESVFAPISRIIQANKYWAVSSSEVLSSRLAKSVLVESQVNAATTRSDQNTLAAIQNSKSIDEALQTLKDDCVPCDDRIRIALEGLPSGADLDAYLEDIRKRIKILTQIDDLLRDVNVFRDLCPLLNVLNFMCVPDLQRMVSLLMAGLFKVNFNMGDQFSMIVSLILPILMPVLSGLVNLLDQFKILVLSPMDCVLDSLLEQLNKLNVAGATQGAIDGIESGRAQVGSALGFGLSEMYTAISEGKDYAAAKLEFYTDALEKALSDWTGGSDAYMILAAQKLRTVQLIQLVVSVIELRQKGAKICQEGASPSASELDIFFSNFLNPNSRMQFAVDPDGNIRIEEPGEVLYQIEEPVEGAKIIAYEPDDLLTKPASTVFKCSFSSADPDEVAKINRWIKELQQAG